MNIKIFCYNLDSDANQQISTISQLNYFRHCQIRIMPDAHNGRNCVIGFTSTLPAEINPSLVGSDIGCGVLSVFIPSIDNFDVFNRHVQSVLVYSKTYVPMEVSLTELEQSYRTLQLSCLFDDYMKQLNLVTQKVCGHPVLRVLGTLGAGNHFLEVGRDKKYVSLLTVHTGSRSLGQKICDFHQKVATSNNYSQEQAEADVDLFLKLSSRFRVNRCYSAQFKSVFLQIMKQRKCEKQISQYLKILPQCYVDNLDFNATLKTQFQIDSYLEDMRVAQVFSQLNRRIIAARILNYFPNQKLQIAAESLHNFIASDNIIRKGAIQACRDQTVVIPLNMKDGVVLGVGKGNSDWNYSAPHGAGRLIKRSSVDKQAVGQILKKDMEGVYLGFSPEAVADEAPCCYKDPNSILSQLSETVEITDQYKTVYNYKQEHD